METQLSFDFLKSKPSLKECPSRSQQRSSMEISSLIQSDLRDWHLGIPRRPLPTPTPPSTSSMAVASPTPTPRSGSQCGETILSTPLSPKERSPDSSIEIWVNGQYSTQVPTLTKLTVTTSNGRLDLYFETGDMLRVSRISTLPNSQASRQQTSSTSSSEVSIDCPPPPYP